MKDLRYWLKANWPCRKAGRDSPVAVFGGGDAAWSKIMTRKIRILLGVLILALSIWLLIWGFAPARRETRIQNISPSEMELPTPSSFRFDPVDGLGASLTQLEIAL